MLAFCESTLVNCRRSVSIVSPLLDDDAQCPELEGPFLHYAATPGLMRAHARWLLVLNYLPLGEFDSAMQAIDEALREADTLDDPLRTSAMLANICLGKLQSARGYFDAAVRAFEAALEIYKEDYHRNYYRPLWWGLGLAYALVGRIADGVGLLERAEAAERKMGSASFRPMLLLHFSRALLAAGRIDDAMQAASDALKRAQQIGNRLSETGAHGLLGELASHRDPCDHDAVESHVLQALRLADTFEMRPVAARCHLRLAWLYERLGRPEYKRHATIATSLLAQMGNPRSLEAAGVQ